MPYPHLQMHPRFAGTIYLELVLAHFNVGVKAPLLHRIWRKIPPFSYIPPHRRRTTPGDKNKNKYTRNKWASPGVVSYVKTRCCRYLPTSCLSISRACLNFFGHTLRTRTELVWDHFCKSNLVLVGIVPADEHVAVPGELRIEELDDLHDEERVPLQTLFRQLCFHCHLSPMMTKIDNLNEIVNKSCHLKNEMRNRTSSYRTYPEPN